MFSLILTSFMVITFSYLFKLIQDMEKKLEHYKNKIDEDVLETNLKCFGKLLENEMESKRDIEKLKDDIQELKDDLEEQLAILKLSNQFPPINLNEKIEELKDDIEKMLNDFSPCNELDDFATLDDIQELKEHFNKSILPSIDKKIDELKDDLEVDVFNLVMDDIRH
ncbi:MAG: hypothetical protein ACW98D_20495, partial [Promethearchaeota archaeon]